MGFASHKPLRPRATREKGGRPASGPVRARRRLLERRPSNVRRPPMHLPADRGPPPCSQPRNSIPADRPPPRKRRPDSRLTLRRPRRRRPLRARRLTWRRRQPPKRRRAPSGLELRARLRPHPDSRRVPEHRALRRARRRRRPLRRLRASPCVPERRALRRARRLRPRHRLRPDNHRGPAQRQVNRTRRRLHWPTPICHRASHRRLAHNSLGHRARLRPPEPRSCSSAPQHRRRWPRMPRSIPGPCRSVSISCAMSASRCRWATRPSSAKRTG